MVNEQEIQIEFKNLERYKISHEINIAYKLILSQMQNQDAEDNEEDDLVGNFSDLM